MALENYGVLIGAFDSFFRDTPQDFGAFYHGHIMVRAPGPDGGLRLHNCAVDVKNPSTTFIEFFHVPSLDAGRFAVVPNLPDGHHQLARASGSGALDYVRNPLITNPLGCVSVALIFLNLLSQQQRQTWTKNIGDEALDTLQAMVEAPDVDKVYVFGARFGSGAPGDSLGMHDVHYNQGDPIDGPFHRLDAIWQDGGTIVRHADGRYEGFFNKFGTQSLDTDANGWPK